MGNNSKAEGNGMDQNHSARKTAIMLIAHGSRNPEANKDLHFVAEKIRKQGKYPIVEPAFLELAEPGIEHAGTRCICQGARRILMIPYFLSAGVHVRKDLSDIRKVMAEQFPDVEFLLGEPLGRHPLLLEVVAQRAIELDVEP